MLRPDIQAIGIKWIAELRLQDRIIAIRYTKNLRNPLGEIVLGLLTILNLDEGRFLVEIQDPETWPVDGSRALSEESITEGLVHELVHIRWIDLTAHNPDPAALVQEERATWATARALVRANSTQRAAIVRAMVAKQAATRRQTKGRSMDAKAVLAAIKEQDEAAALTILEQWLADQIGNGAGAPPSVPKPGGPMGADAGVDPEKDKPPMNMGDKPEQYQRAAKAGLADIRAMRAAAEKDAADVKAAAEILRPQAKAEIVRGMRADGIVLTPHAEKLILDAPTVEAAKERAEVVRAMAPAGTKRTQALPPTGDAAGLTRSQAANYDKLIAKGNATGAETYRAECIKLNTKGGA